MKSTVKILKFVKHGDERGSLIALEAGQQIPFEIKRVYYIFGTKEGVGRGFHAHRKLKQILIAVSGRVRIHCELAGRVKEVWLDSPAKGLFIEGLVWREMHDFTSDAVLLVIANNVYTETDYIRDYNEFKRLSI